MFSHLSGFVLIWTLFYICGADIETKSIDIETKDLTKDLTTDDFQVDCLLTHNKLRDKHCSKDIRFSSKLKTLATRRATYLAENDGKRYTRIPEASFGENVFRHRYRGNSTQSNCKAIVLKWYKEKTYYNWNTTNRGGARTRRFAQIVWNSTQKIGCASVASVGPTGHVFTVCNYYNLVKFPTNSSQNVISINKCEQILSKRRFRYKALTTGKWLQQCIREHNRLRKLHEVGPLTIDEGLYATAEKRAIGMAQKGFRFFRHMNSKYGENIHWSKANQINGSLDCNASISKWYQEKDRYDWNTRLNHNGTVRHFMQIIWKSSTNIGCSQIQNLEEPKGGIYTVCMYEPKADLSDPDMQWENVFLEVSLTEKVEPVVTYAPLAPGPVQDYEKVDELDEETELEKEFKDVDDIIDTRRIFDRQTPAPSLEDMYIKTSTEFNGFDRSEYIHKSKGLRRKN